MSSNPVVNAMIESLRSMSPEQLQQLSTDMWNDTKLFAKICFPHILTENLSPEEKQGYLDGTLPMEVYMPDFHQKIYNGYDLLFQGVKQNMGIVVYRGSAKTTSKVIATTKAICFALEPFILFINETVEQAAVDLEAVKSEIEDNEIINLLFGNLKGDVWNARMATFFVGPHVVALKATGLNSRIRGIKFGNQRPTLAISDDFESEGNSLTDLGREKVNIAIESKILKLGDYIYKLVFQGTIIDNRAFLANIEKNPRFNGSKGIIIRAELSHTNSIYYDRVSENYRAAPAALFNIGTPSWPRRYPLEYIQREFEMAKTVNGGQNFWQFLQEYYNIPKHTVTNEFKPEKFQEENAVLKNFKGFNFLEYADGKKEAVYLFEGFDPAAGRGDNNDFSTHCILAVNPSGKLIVVNLSEQRIDIDQQADLIIKTNRARKIRATGLEAYGYQLTLKNYIQKQADAQKVRVNLVKYSDSRSGGKNKLKELLGPMIDRGELVYLKGCPIIDTLKMQMANFSSKSVHDDLLDAVFLAVWVAGNAKPSAVNVDKRITELKQMDIPGFTQMKRRVRSAMAL